MTLEPHGKLIMSVAFVRYVVLFDSQICSLLVFVSHRKAPVGGHLACGAADGAVSVFDVEAGACSSCRHLHPEI
jgi:hypothetical protein